MVEGFKKRNNSLNSFDYMKIYEIKEKQSGSIKVQSINI